MVARVARRALNKLTTASTSIGCIQIVNCLTPIDNQKGVIDHSRISVRH
jgi:hypothetical protein